MGGVRLETNKEIKLWLEWKLLMIGLVSHRVHTVWEVILIIEEASVVWRRHLTQSQLCTRSLRSHICPSNRYLCVFVGDVIVPVPWRHIRSRGIAAPNETELANIHRADRTLEALIFVYCWRKWLPQMSIARFLASFYRY